MNNNVTHYFFLAKLGFFVPLQGSHVLQHSRYQDDFCVHNNQGWVEHSIKHQKKGLPNLNPATRKQVVNTRIGDTLRILWFYLIADIT